MATKIESSAADAVKVIAMAAREATKAIADAAAEAVKVTATAVGNDHDTLIAFRAETVAELKNVRSDIQTLTNGTTSQIAEHETRINALETSKTAQTVLLSVGIGLITILTSTLIYHITN